MGGEIRFRTKLTQIWQENGKLKSIIVNGDEEIATDFLVLAIGHSARDTFEMLEREKFLMQAKSFAVGLRIEHPQSMIDEYQYGTKKHAGKLGAASYKLTHRAEEGRGVYSFCMCPGGYVVNASSEEGRLAVNGMSYQDRSAKNANSAMIVSVNPNDFCSQGALAGVAFQRQLEEKAYQLGKGKVPVQLFGDFMNHRKSSGFGMIDTCMKGAYEFADLNELLPEFLSRPMKESISYFGRIISGFSREDAVLSGIESRTSSPVRIVRKEDFQSNVEGVYPCGEGAGYAGGITWASNGWLESSRGNCEKYNKFLRFHIHRF